MAKCSYGVVLGASSIRYTLSDLGPSAVSLGYQTTYNYTLTTPYSPDNPDYYTAPQVDSSGKISYHAGVTQSGNYSFTTSVIPSHNSPFYAFASANFTGPNDGGFYFPIVPGRPYFDTLAGGVNSRGMAVGFTGGDRVFAFFIAPDGVEPSGLQHFACTPIPGLFPSSLAEHALGINGAGMIVGDAESDRPGIIIGGLMNRNRAMLSDGRTSLDLNTLIAPGSPLTLITATSINDLGQIAGLAYDAKDGSTHTFLLTPESTPEPGAWAVAAAAMGYLGLRRLAGRGGLVG